MLSLHVTWAIPRATVHDLILNRGNAGAIRVRYSELGAAQELLAVMNQHTSSTKGTVHDYEEE